YIRDRRLVEVFRREVANAARLRHRNLITIYELGDHDGRPFAAMQDLDGGELRRTIQAQIPLTLLQKLTIMWQVGEGLRASRNGDPEAVRNSVPECPETLERLIDRALDKNRARRYQSMAEVQDDAEPIVYELKSARAATLLADARRLQEHGDIEQAQGVMRE